MRPTKLGIYAKKQFLDHCGGTETEHRASLPTQTSMNQLELNVRRNRAGQRNSSYTLNRSATDPGLSTKPNIGKVKFFEVRKKKKAKGGAIS